MAARPLSGHCRDDRAFGFVEPSGGAAWPFLPFMVHARFPATEAELGVQAQSGMRRTSPDPAPLLCSQLRATLTLLRFIVGRAAVFSCPRAMAMNALLRLSARGEALVAEMLRLSDHIRV